MLTFSKPFTQQESLPEAAIEAAVAVMRHGRLHRYNTLAGEISETAQLEQEFAGSLDIPFCLATASGGTALQIALAATGAGPGSVVLTNAFTLAPVPGAIKAVGASPVFVETTEELVIDLDDLARKAESSGASILMLSHMRGHLVDMHRISAFCETSRMTLIEDCAHTMGASWAGQASGTFGAVGCFSTQTYKHINSGEGGFLVTRSPDLMARAVIRSGSYMLHDRHLAGPGPEAYVDARLDTPNCSSRMDNLRAAVLRPQLADLDRQVRRWEARYQALEAVLRAMPDIQMRTIPQAERHVGSSIQFRLPGMAPEQVQGFLDRTLRRGVELKWFGAADPHGYTSRHPSWRYADPQHLPETDRILSTLFDMRIPLTFTVADCELIARIIADSVRET